MTSFAGEATRPLVRVAPTLDGLEAELVREAGLVPPLVVVCDTDTVEVLGRRVARAVRGEPLVLERPHADLATAEELRDRCRHAGSLVAVGSGTLNDLVKWAADRLGLPCAVFATAPSMNGWLTATASLAVRGVKRSLPVSPPAAAFFDLAVVAAAPRRLLAAGIGDGLCRPTVEADLRLAHRLVGERFEAGWFAATREPEERVRAAAGRIVAGEVEAVRHLVDLLVAQSLVMRRAGSSAPASQGEHAVAHILECFARPRPDAFHGELVALATTAVAAVQRHLLARTEAPPLGPVRVNDRQLRAVFGGTAEEARRAIAEMGLDDAVRVRDLAVRLRRLWPSLRAELAEPVRQAAERPPLFAAVGLPVAPRHLGLDPGFCDRAVGVAFGLRPRFGFLALAALADEIPGNLFPADENR